MPFEPVEVLSYLMGNNRDGESWGTQTEAIKIYLKLKQLMDEMDDIDDSSDEDGNKKDPKGSEKYSLFYRKIFSIVIVTFTQTRTHE